MIEDTVTLGNLIGYLTIAGAGYGFILNARKVRRENEADGRARTDELKGEFAKVEKTLSERLTIVEYKIQDFMPRKEIEDKIEHEKNNRTQSDEALRRITDNLSRDVRDIMIGQSKIEQQHIDTASSVVDIKNSIKELSKDIGARFDKISTSISSLSSGHRVKGQINHEA